MIIATAMSVILYPQITLHKTARVSDEYFTVAQKEHPTLNLFNLIIMGATVTFSG